MTIWEQTHEWFTGARRAEALRRLGGPDVLAEKKRLAMDGDNKAWVLGIWAVAAFLGWMVWNFAQYQTAARIAEAQIAGSQAAAEASRPSIVPATMLECVDTCARSCIGAEMRQGAEIQ